jgi:2-deoxy-D-gluconate 3-dehydrogenase
MTAAHAIVTGASSGIGRACTLALARDGAMVTALGRDLERLQSVARAISEIGADATVDVVDVTDEAAVAAAVAEAQERAPLTVCVNAAGLNRTGPTAGYAAADFDLVLGTNVRGTFLVCREVGAAMIKHGKGGRIVNISSQMGAVGYPGRAAYCASKHAVNGLTKALAVEWAPHDITVNAVAPTFVRTPMTEHMLDDPDFRADVLRRIPLGRTGDVDDVTAAVCFLVSPGAGLITGAVVPVDGGWVAW